MTYALVIDDNQPLLESLKTTTALAGLNLLGTDSWDEGLRLFHIHSPELVIADYNLPGSEHGLKLLAEIRQLRPSVRLVLISGFLNEDDVRDIEHEDLADRVLLKTNAADMMPALIDEIREAKKRSDADTDWAQYARAFKRARAVSPERLKAFDTALREKRNIR